jgi:hypothetical protein
MEKLAHRKMKAKRKNQQGNMANQNSRQVYI